MHSGRGLLATLTVALAVGCTSSVSAATRVAQYADGDWGCRFRSVDLDAELAVGVHATEETSGTVTFRWVRMPYHPANLAGSWELDGDRLEVRLHSVPRVQDDVDSSVGPTHARNVRLDARRITVRGETAHRPGSGDPVPVTVRRTGEHIVFGFEVTPVEIPGHPRSRHATVACTKSA